MTFTVEVTVFLRTFQRICPLPESLKFQSRHIYILSTVQQLETVGYVGIAVNVTSC